jgi:hypothetical protein
MQISREGGALIDRLRVLVFMITLFRARFNRARRRFFD